MAAGRIVRDTVGFALSQYAARAMLLVRGVLSARALTPAGFGSWNALGLILDYGAYAPLGALDGLDRRLPAAAARGDAAAARRLCRGALGLASAGGAAFAVLAAFLLAAGLAPPALAWGAGPAALMIAAALLQILVAYHQSVLRANGRVAVVSRSVALQAGLGGGLGAALVFPFGVWGLLVPWVAGQVAALAALRRAGVAVPLAVTARPPARELLGPGVPIFAFFLTALLLRSADRVALMLFGGAEALGLYSLGLLAASLVHYLPEAAGYVLYPRVAGATAAGGDAARALGELVRGQRALCALLPAAVGLAALWAEPVVARWLPDYLPGIPALRVLLAAALALSTATLPAYYLLACGGERRALGVGAAVALPAVAVIVAVASRWWEPLPVALAAAAGQAAFAAALMATALPRLGRDGAERRRIVAASVLPAAWAILLVAGLGRLPLGLGTAGSLLRSALFLLGYGPALVLACRGLGLRALWRNLAPGRARPAVAPGA